MEIIEVCKIIADEIKEKNSIDTFEPLMEYFEQEFDKESKFIKKGLLKKENNYFYHDDRKFFKIKYDDFEKIEDINMEYFYLKDHLKQKINEMNKYSEEFIAERIIKHFEENGIVENISSENKEPIEKNSEIIIYDDKLYTEYYRLVRDYKNNNSRANLNGTIFISQNLENKYIISFNKNIEKPLILYKILVGLIPVDKGPNTGIYIHLYLKFNINSEIENLIKIYKVVE